MAHETIKVWELVDRAVSHKWSVPEFQRGFVWKSTQVRDLAESLWLDYPVGSILVWGSSQEQEERVAKDSAKPSLWIVDGQQRSTALCILFGRKPYWWNSADVWNKTLKRYDIRFDVDAKEPPYFWVANAAIRKAKGDRYVPLRELMTLDVNRESDQKKLQDLAKNVKVQGLCDGMDAMEVYTRLDRVRKVRDKELVTVTIHHELEDVVEIFGRLNSKGTRVTEADIYLGIVASKNPGWVRDEFLPFTSVLGDSGFHIDPNLLFRTVTAVGIGKVRFKDIDEKFWEPTTIKPAWVRAQDAWKRAVQRLQAYGILSDDPLPTQAALVTVVAVLDKFPKEANFDPLFYWFIQASRFGRYSASGTTALDEDLRDVKDSDTYTETITKLLARLQEQVRRPFSPDDFTSDYTDGKFGRFLLYLLVYKNKAQDWDETGARLGFQGSEILADFTPQWHHIYPQKFLRGKVEPADIDSLANIAVIGPNINIRISAQDPMKYLDKYGITDEKLRQQFIDQPRSDFTVNNYPRFLEHRAKRLAEEANKFLAELSASLPQESRPVSPGGGA